MACSAAARLAALALMAALSICWMSSGAEASCTVKNNSGKKIIIVPVEVEVEVEVEIEVEIGASVELPVYQQHCYFINSYSGDRKGPVTLTDGALYVIVDAEISGVVDVFLGLNVLGIIKLGVKIIVGL